MARDGSITTESGFNAGGEINISSSSIALSGDSDITTFVGSGLNRGGNITIVADALTALDDSDILAFSIDGQGGNVDLSRTAFFGQKFDPAPPGTDPRTLDNNNRVDINATGQLSSGDISLLDISFIENSLTELPDDLVNTEALVASSCINPTANNTDSFTIRNRQSIAQQPDDVTTTYSVGQVQAINDSVSGVVTEPQQIYRLADGRLVMSRDCGADASTNNVTDTHIRNRI